MATLKCKMCGGDLEILDGEYIAECEYCGTRQTVPILNDAKKGTLFDRANRLRMKSEFDKAASVYENIVNEFPEEAEAYWGLCLCKYGIEYVDDPVTAKKIPTCHRTSYEGIFKDTNFELTQEYAEGEARSMYREEAKEIDRLQKAILEIAQKEEPFDIFICYKETDENGNRTKDSVRAQEIYNELTKEGYKVFFSRITLEDKLGEAYEPYIFSALNSSKIMLAIGTKYDYYNAVWVKNEWARFLEMMKKDPSKILIPCYSDIDAYDMPEEFSNLQGQDMAKIGFLQDLLRGISKITGRNQEYGSTSGKPESGQASISTQIVNYMKRGFMSLEDGDYSSAMDFFERVLSLDAECGKAYLGKALCKMNVGSGIECADQITKRIIALAQSQTMIVPKPDIITVARRADQNFGLLSAFSDDELTRTLEDYEQELSVDTSYEYYNDVLSAFGKEQLRELINDRNFDRALQFADEETLSYIDEVCEAVIENVDRLVKTEEQKIQDVRDGKVTETKIATVLSKVNEEQKTDGSTLESRQLKKLVRIELSERTRMKSQIFNNKGIGDTIEFGAYLFNDKEEKETLMWRILDIQDNKVLILLEIGLAVKKYNEDKTDVTWRDCSLRQFLNKDLPEVIFSNTEYEMIMKSQISNQSSAKAKKSIEYTTEDILFLLSIEEVKKYLPLYENRVLKPAHWVLENTKLDQLVGIRRIWWWLRSPGRSKNSAAFIYPGGEISDSGVSVDSLGIAVRPACWIDISDLV